MKCKREWKAPSCIFFSSGAHVILFATSGTQSARQPAVKMTSAVKIISWTISNKRWAAERFARSPLVVVVAAAAHPHADFNIVLPLTELFVCLRSLRRHASLERLNLRTRWKNMAAIKRWALAGVAFAGHDAGFYKP